MTMHNVPWRRITVIAMISAAMIGVQPIASRPLTSDATATEFEPVQIGQADVKKAQTNFYINTPSIHESVWNELIRGVLEDVDAGRSVTRRTNQEGSAKQGQQPTSMLWPAYKYLPHLSYSFAT